MPAVVRIVPMRCSVSCISTAARAARTSWRSPQKKIRRASPPNFSMRSAEAAGHGNELGERRVEVLGELFGPHLAERGELLGHRREPRQIGEDERALDRPVVRPRCLCEPLSERAGGRTGKDRRPAPKRRPPPTGSSVPTASRDHRDLLHQPRDRGGPRSAASLRRCGTCRRRCHRRLCRSPTRRRSSRRRRRRSARRRRCRR